MGKRKARNYGFTYELLSPFFFSNSLKYLGIRTTPKKCMQNMLLCSNLRCKKYYDVSNFNRTKCMHTHTIKFVELLLKYITFFGCNLTNANGPEQVTRQMSSWEGERSLLQAWKSKRFSGEDQ